MAVPKKKTSKSKKRQRFANWRAKVKLSIDNAIVKAKMLLSNRSNFKYKDENDNEAFEDDDAFE